ncbi:VOC family protein [Sutcliffiella cohnii]
MEIQFDHIVHYCSSPERVMDQFIDNGLKAVEGGVHANWGTYNCLCFFNNLSYIEWIGINDVQQSKETENPLIKQLKQEGFVQLAFRTENMNLLAKNLKEKGYQLLGPLPGSRKKNDGSELKWSMLFIVDDHHNSLPYPFFIQREESFLQRKETLKNIINEGEISYININGPDVYELATTWAKLFGLQEPLRKSSNKGNSVSYHLSFNNCTINFFPAAKSHTQIHECGINVNNGLATIGCSLILENGHYSFIKKSISLS